MEAYKSKTMLAVEALREMILDGRIAPGQRFDVRGVAADLNMSITPVREALRILQADGFVSYDEHRAISAMELRPDDAKELYLLRSMLESLATQLAAEQWSDGDARLIRQAHEEMVEAVAAGDAAAASAANRNWHFAVYRSARTHFIEPFITRLWNQFAWSSIWAVPGRLERSVTDHAAITEALLARDGSRAAELMRQHITGGRAAVLEHGDGHPDGQDGQVGDKPPPPGG